MEQQCFGQRLLPDRREEPVHEQLGGVGMRRLVDDAVGLGHGRHAGLREDEGKRRALGLELDVARILGAHDDLVLAVDQPAVLLDVGVEGARLLLGELLEVALAQDRLQRIPDAVLQARVGDLDVDRVLPLRIEQVLPRLGRLGGRHVVGVIGDAGHDDRAPGPEAFRLALGLLGEELHLGRDVLAEAALALEVQDHAHVGDLDDVDQVGLGLALRQHLGVERTGLQADIAGLDLGEELVEGGQQLDLALLGIGRIEREGALGLGLGHVGAALEALHLAGLLAQLGILRLASPDQPMAQTAIPMTANSFMTSSLLHLEATLKARDHRFNRCVMSATRRAAAPARDRAGRW